MERTILSLEQRAAIEDARKAMQNLQDNGLGLWFDPEMSDLVVVDERDIESMELCFYGNEPKNELLEPCDEYFDDKISILPDAMIIAQIPDEDCDIYILKTE